MDDLRELIRELLHELDHMSPEQIWELRREWIVDLQSRGIYGHCKGMVDIIIQSAVERSLKIA